MRRVSAEGGPEHTVATTAAGSARSADSAGPAAGNGKAITPEDAALAQQVVAKSNLTVPDAVVLNLLGSGDENLRVIEELVSADVHVRGNEITLTGKPAEVAFAERLFAELLIMVGKAQPLSADSVRRTVGMLSADAGESPAEVLSLDILSRRGRSIRPKTLNQKRYVDAIDKNTIVFGIGPAGTGKTYLAMAKAVQALQAKQVNRIILTRPAVEAGERLGYLPGTLHDKIDPYLRPLYDALHDMVDPESVPRLTQAGTIEVAPLAYMRGRTLNDAFIILDEAQNTTPEQMKMFLTRLGFGSKIVVTGDITQVDLPGSTRSGLRVVRDILDGVEDVHFSMLTSHDVVRHRLVSDIVDAYERWQVVQEHPQAPASDERSDARTGRGRRQGR
ncbi:phosphate starvation-inducible protein PhoH, predicted ATPase [Actinoalloteichus hymeniacidonis]|uniref:PhoH-like protein n=1 Tax=Actinoalloteichus hymeniacidonis TaxID=340345 RepID=A0AAC9HTI5_9PSEU|nr:phosphate starvation-inducible protein PhoH, predicted ATPase [Actinoalloteichus hymeniacidonis]